MTLPNTFIAGVNKAGTTSVFAALASSPDVSASLSKETGFFEPVRYGRSPGPLSEYEKYFDARATEPIVLEATPSYFYGGRETAEALREVAPDGRVILILREPVSRAFSWWRFAKSRLRIPQDVTFSSYIERAIPMGLGPELDEDAVGWRGVSGGLYAEWLPEWIDVWGDRLKVLFQDDLNANFDASVDGLARWLDIRSGSGAVADSNISTDISNAAIQRLALRLNDRGEVFWRRFPGLKRALRRGYYGLNASRRQEVLADSDREVLRVFYAESVAQLRALTIGVPTAW